MRGMWGTRIRPGLEVTCEFGLFLGECGELGLKLVEVSELRENRE